MSRDGRPLLDALQSPLIGVRKALKDGKPPEAALDVGLHRATRMVNTDFMHAARTSLNDAMVADPNIVGWQRAVKGTCGACLGDIAVEVRVELPEVPLMIHPNCQCVTVPVVSGARNLFPLPTGKELFDRMTPTEQDAGLGPAAERIRAGDATLTDLVATSPLVTDQPDFLTQRSVAT